jgi:homopolymeric O-antigen transport system permease protein
MTGPTAPVAETVRAPVEAPAEPVLELEPGAASRREWIGSMWDHRGVIRVLARKDFQARYKRASLGVLWAVVAPLLQAAVMIFVFSHFVHVARGVPYAAFVLSGILAWAYFALVLPQATTAIVDGTSLTDKLWFPRGVLPLTPCVSNLVGLGISMVILLIGAPIVGADPSLHLLILIPACLLLVTFTIALTMVLSALHVYFRDVKFIVGASIMVWFYATPIMYPKWKVGSLGPWLDLNPMTGIISLFHLAVIGHDGFWERSVIISIVATIALLIAGLEVHRRHDRLFVDLL